MLRSQVTSQLSLGLKLGLIVLKALPYVPVAKPFVLEPCCVAAEYVVSIFASLVCADIRLEVVKYMGPPHTFFALASRTDKPAVRTQELRLFRCCGWWRWEVNTIAVKTKQCWSVRDDGLGL